MPKREYPGERQFAYWRKRLKDPSFVYVVRDEDEGPIKIGVGKNVHARIAAFKTGNWREITLMFTLVGDRELEWQLHYALRRNRVRGEWFGGEEVEAFLPFIENLAAEMVTNYHGMSVPHFSWFPGPNNGKWWPAHTVGPRAHVPAPIIRKTSAPNPTMDPERAQWIRDTLAGRLDP